MTPQTLLGKRVIEARERVRPKLSRRKLADRLQAAGLDVKPSDVADIEAGKRSLNYYQVSVLAAALNSTVNELLT